MNKTLLTGFLLLGSSFTQPSFADSVTPEEPEAYEPFTLEIEVITSNPPTPDPHMIDISDNTVVVGYRTGGPGFGVMPPQARSMTVEISGLSPGTYEVKTAHMREFLFSGVEIEDTGFTFTVADSPPTQQVYSFYHEGIDHYFITASDGEADEVYSNHWNIIDFGFNAWHSEDPAPEAAVPVCRFYSYQVNSHFYTGDEEECTRLQEEDHGWEYEGIAFQALIPVDGACPAGTDPVWRLYNNRFAEMDSNHRFVTNRETYRSMIAEGWLGEGVAFCSPPASEETAQESFTTSFAL